MSSRFNSLYKGAVLAFVLFFTAWTAEAACFSRQQLYRLQTSSLEEIQAYLKAEGWALAEPSSVAEGTSLLALDSRSRYSQRTGSKG